MSGLGGPPPGQSGPPAGYSGPPVGYTGPPQGYGGPPPGYGFAPYGSPRPSSGRLSPGMIVAVFVGVLLAIALIAGAFVFLTQPPPPVPPCQPGQPCAPRPPSLPPIANGTPFPIATQPSGPSAAPVTPGATGSPSAAPSLPVPTATPQSDSPPVVTGTVWRDANLNYSFEYDPDIFTLSDEGDGIAVLSGVFFDTQIIIRAVTADTPPAQLMSDELAVVDRFLISRVADTDPYDALLGPSIGYVRGEGGVFAGTLVSRDGTPLAPGGVTIAASTDGRITVAVVVIVGTPDARKGGETQQHSVRQAADEILKTFDWDTR